MGRQPKIAILKPDEKDASVFSNAFPRHRYAIDEVEGVGSLVELHSDPNTALDVVIVPLHLFDRSSGITHCLKLKSDQVLSTVPIVGISSSKDKAILQAFYGAGADAIFIPPLDPDLVQFQVEALTRQRRLFNEQLNRNYERAGLQHSILCAFHSLRNGLILSDTEHRIAFANNAAVAMLKLSSPPPKEELSRIAYQFMTVAQRYDDKLSSFSIDSPPIIHETSLTGLNGQAFKAELRISPLRSNTKELIGYAFAIVDLSETEELATILVQGQRTRSLALLSAVGCLKAIEQLQQKTPTAPITEIEKFLKNEPAQSSLATTLTALLEVIDPILSPTSTLKINLGTDEQLAVRSSDLFQLLGHMILHAVEQAGTYGEISVNSSFNSNDRKIILSIVAISSKHPPLVPNDYITRLIDGNYPQSPAQPTIQKLTYGVAMAQAIANRYRAEVRFEKNLSDFKIEVLLPAIAN